MITQSRWELVAQFALDDEGYGVSECEKCPACLICEKDNSENDFKSCSDILKAWASEEPIVPEPVEVKDMPTEEGWYWIDRPYPTICMIRKDAHGSFLGQKVSGYIFYCANVTYKYAGPITHPKEWPTRIPEPTEDKK